MPPMKLPAKGEPRLLATCGHKLFGSQQATKMAELLGVDRKTVYRWYNGRTQIPPEVWPKVFQAIDRKVIDLQQLSNRIPHLADWRSRQAA